MQHQLSESKNDESNQGDSPIETWLPSNLRLTYQEKWHERREALLARGLQFEDICAIESVHQGALQKFEDVSGRGRIGEIFPDRSEALDRAAFPAWLRGEVVPWDLRWLIHDHPNSHPIQIPQTHSDDFAYIIGAYLVNAPGEGGYFRIGSQDYDAIENLSACFRREFGIEIEPHEDLTGPTALQKIAISSSQLLDYLDANTAGGKRFPWEHLTSPSERRNCLRAILDFNSGVSHKTVARPKKEPLIYPIVGVTATNRPEFVLELRQLFFLNKIYPLYKTDSQEPGVERLEIGGETDIENLKKIGFHSKRKTAALENICGKTKRVMRDYGPDEYLLAESVQDLPVRTAARSTGISRDLIKRWREGTKPERVKRWESALGATKELVCPDDVVLLRKELGLSPSVSVLVSNSVPRTEIAKLKELSFKNCVGLDFKLRVFSVVLQNTGPDNIYLMMRAQKELGIGLGELQTLALHSNDWARCRGPVSAKNRTVLDKAQFIRLFEMLGPSIACLDAREIHDANFASHTMKLIGELSFQADASARSEGFLTAYTRELLRHASILSKFDILSECIPYALRAQGELLLKIERTWLWDHGSKATHEELRAHLNWPIGRVQSIEAYFKRLS